MQARILKEWTELRTPFVLVLVLLTANWFGLADVTDTLLDLREEPVLATFLAAAALGLVLGFVQHSLERWRGTSAYLEHRRGGAHAMYLAKIAVGLPLSWCLGFLPPAAWGVWQLLAAPEREALLPERLLDHALISLAGPACYAVAAVAACLRMSNTWGGVLSLWGGYGAGFSLLVLGFCSGTGAAGAARFILGVAVFVAAFLVLGSWLVRDDRDRDLPLGGRASAAMALASFIFVTLVWGAQMGIHSSNLIQFARAADPQIVYDPTRDEVFGLRRVGFAWERIQTSNGGRDWIATPSTEAQSDPFGDGSDWLRLSTSLQRPVRTRIESHLDDPQTILSFTRNLRRLTMPSGRTWNAEQRQQYEAYLDRDRGTLEFFALPSPLPGVAPVRVGHWSVSKPGGRFDAESLPLVFDERHVAVLDPGDGRIWFVDPADASAELGSIALPEGERIVSNARLVPPSAFGGPAKGYLALLRGEHTNWVVLDGLLVPHDAALHGALAQQSPRRPRVECVEHDALDPRFEVRDAETGELRFAIAFGRRGAIETLVEWALVPLALMQSPISAALSFALGRMDPDSPLPAHWPWQSLYFDHARSLLLLVVLALGVGLVIDTAQRMSRRAAGVIERAAWIAMVAAFGLPVWILFRLLEPARQGSGDPALRAAPSAAIAPLLIQST